MPNCGLIEDDIPEHVHIASVRTMLAILGTGNAVYFENEHALTSLVF